MPYIEETSSNERSIGKVKWFGGYNSKTQRVNKFGFLDSIENDNLYVHESGLRCAPLDMVDGRWVTFRVVGGRKGPSAVEVELAENELHLSTITRLLNTREIPIKIRVQISFHVPLEEGHPLIPILAKTIEEYDCAFLKDAIDFPDYWKEINPESPLFKILPEKIKRDWFSREYPSIKQAIDVLSNSVPQIERDTEIYSSMSRLDRQLALSWSTTDRDYEKAKMLSARGAELITAEFFSEIGRSVVDVAIHQITGESEQWRTHDLLIDSTCSVDVKNARCTINSSTFVEYTIKRFKLDSQGKNVIIIGVLSPYLVLKELERKSLLHRKSIKILGTATKNQVQNLAKEFSKRELTVDFGDTRRWPIWIFNNDLNWFSSQKKAIAEFSKHAVKVKYEEWSGCQQNMIPAFLIAGMEIPKYYRENLLPWQNWYLDKVLEKSELGELTLPWLYLFTFHHFLEAITNIESAELKQYSPGGYSKILYYSENETKRPASLVDPVLVINKLIKTLSTLWDQRHSTHLGYLRKFVLRGEGLLTGIDPRGIKVTVLAYCGGFIEGKGKCGHSPLVIGQHETCITCQMLICNECGYCSERCMKKTKNVRSY